MRKYIFILISILLLFLPIKINAESKYLYDVLKDEAENGELARKYTGEHKDSYTEEPSKDIYHWYAENTDSANQIINKRNVLFGGYCWSMFRTTDTGGVKLIYDGIPVDGKCNTGSNIIGKNGYSIRDNLESYGSAGYMYNTLYRSPDYATPTYGSFYQNGTSLQSTDYVIVKNDSTVPFTFSSNQWRSGKQNGYSKSGDISFSVSESGDYLLDYSFIRDSKYDSVTIYKNDEIIAKISYVNSNFSGILPLNNLQTTDIIKVSFHADYNETNASVSFMMKRPFGSINDTRAYFGNKVNYSDGTYTLVDTIRSDGTQDLAYNHYYCLDGSISCSTVYYAVFWSGMSISSAKLTNGITIEDYLNNQLYVDDVNKYDSSLKSTIDSWYENNLINYQKYLEDTIFCQKKNLVYPDNGLNPNGGNPGGGSSKLAFYMGNTQEGYLYNSNLKCINRTDMYSMSNQYAKLKYPVATINFAEQLLMSNNIDNGAGALLRSANDNYWTMTPREIGTFTYGWVTWDSGGLSYSFGADNRGIRPVVSLKNGIKYKSGDGSKDNPYIVNEYYSVSVEAINETSDINVLISDINEVDFEEEVKIKITPIRGYKLKSLTILDKNDNEISFNQIDNTNEYTFIMPASDITIIPSYEKVANSILVDEDNKEEIIIEVNDSSAVLYEDKVLIKIEPKDGYIITGLTIIDENGNTIDYKSTGNDGEYEFTMPDSNVTIKPLYKEISVPDTNKDNNYTIYFILIVVLLLIGIAMIIFNKITKKK